MKQTLIGPRILDMIDPTVNKRNVLFEMGSATEEDILMLVY